MSGAMKTAQDISPSVVVCLALGLLVGNVLMPEHQKFEYLAGWSPVQEATITPLDLSEGRSFERLPDNLERGTEEIERTYIQNPQNEAWKGNGTAVQELFDLSQHRLGAEKPALMSDAAAMLTIVFFVCLGMASAFVDMTELSEDAKKESPQTIASNATQLRNLKFFTFCITSVAVSALVLLFCSTRLKGLAAWESSSDEQLDLNFQELRKLDKEQRPPLASDSFVVLMLGAFLVLAVFVMTVDIREMAEELRRNPDRKISDAPKVQEKKPAHRSYPCVSSSLAAIGILATLTSIAIAMWPTGRVLTSFAEEANITELKALVDSSFNVLLDYVLEIFLGACTLLGLAVMRVDICDMVSELQDSSGSKMTSASASRLDEKVKAC